MGYWERQLSRQAEHSSFHLCFLPSQMFKGVHKQLRILKVETLKPRENHQKCVWGGPNMLVKEGCEAQKWKCENPPQSLFSSQHEELQPWFLGFPRHTQFPPHTLSHLQLPLSLPQAPFFPCSALQHQQSLQLKESSFISILPWAPAAKLPVCLWGQLVIFCVSVRLCVFIESRKEHSLLFRCQLDLVAAAVGKARISLWVVNWTTCYGAAEGD